MQAVGFQAPPDSPSAQAAALFAERFPRLAAGLPHQVLVAVEAAGRPSVLTEEVAAWSEELVRRAERDSRSAGFAPLAAGYFVGVPKLGIPPRDPMLKEQLVSADGRTTLLAFLGTASPAPREDCQTWCSWLYQKELVAFMREACSSPPEGARVTLTGSLAVAFDVIYGHNETDTKLLLAELRVLPLALLVFALLVRDCRLLALPPVVLAVSLLVAASALLPMAWSCPLSTDLPPSMLSLVMALSLDYSLFLIGRFSESRGRCFSVQQSVDVLMQQTVKTIVVSGLLIAIAYFGSALVPEDNLRFVGIALGLTTLIVVVVSSTVMPAMLLLLAPLLTGPWCPGSLASARAASARRKEHEAAWPHPYREGSEGDSGEALLAEDAPSEARSTGHSSPRSFGGAAAEADGASPWARVARLVGQCPLTAAGLILALSAPLLAQLPGLRASADLYATVPDAPSIAALRRLQPDFVVGRFDPYAVVVVADAAPLLDRDGYDSMLGLGEGLLGLGGVGSLLGPGWLGTERIGLDRSKRLPRWQRRLYDVVLDTHVNGSAALLQVHTRFLPRGARADEWVRRARGALHAWEGLHPGWRAALSGGACAATDASDATLGALPSYLGACLAGCGGLVLLMFRSLLLPLRLGGALVFTLAATFGVAAVIYQTPLLHGICPELRNFDGICYQAIPIAVCVAVALGIDYDIFLVSRIFEYRLSGLGDCDSIVQGVARTGGIISGAGIIMALAFSGMLYSDRLLHRQIAVILVVSVLLDTFVVRTVLVPASMFVAREWNWWPRRVPRGRRSTHRSQEVLFTLLRYAMGFGQLAATSQFYLYGRNHFTQTGYQKHRARYAQPDILSQELDLSGKVYMITGANSGVGKEVAQYLASRNATIYMVCRSRQRAEAARDEILATAPQPRGKVHVIQADVGLEADVRRCWLEFSAAGEGRLDGLVCNAGALLNEKTLTSEGVEVTFASHLLFGTYLLGELAMPTLEATPGSRIAVVSSGGMYNFPFPAWEVATSTSTDPTVKYDGQFAYGYAKRGQVLLCERWAELHPAVVVASCHPGWTSTPAVEEAYGSSKKYLEPMRTPWEGAEGIIWLLVAPAEKIQPGAFYLDREPQVKHLAGPFFTEGSFTKNTKQEVVAMMEKLKEWSSGGRSADLKAFAEAQVLATEARTAPLAAMERPIDIERFMGRWYVIYNIPTPFDKGTANNVENYSYDAASRRVDIDFTYTDMSFTKTSLLKQRATVKNTENTQWSLSPKIGVYLPTSIPYLVADCAEDYSTCIIGVPDRKYIWVMARTPEIGAEEAKALTRKAQVLGYDVAKLVTVPQKWAEDQTAAGA